MTWNYVLEQSTNCNAVLMSMELSVFAAFQDNVMLCTAAGYQKKVDSWFTRDNDQIRGGECKTRGRLVQLGSSGTRNIWRIYCSQAPHGQVGSPTHLPLEVTFFKLGHATPNCDTTPRMRAKKANKQYEHQLQRTVLPLMAWIFLYTLGNLSPLKVLNV